MIAPTDHIQLRLKIGNQEIEEVDLVSKRTLMAARALEGKSIQDTLNLLPLLFSLCGTAQHQAGLKAMEQALGIVPSKTQKAARDILIDAEGIGEHITRVMMDWSTHAYVDTKMIKIRECRKRLGEFKSLIYKDNVPDTIGGSPLFIQAEELHRHCIELIDVCEQDIFGCPLDQFYSLRNENDLKVWQTGNNAVASACMKIWTHHGFFEHDWPKAMILPDLPDLFLNKRLDGEDADAFIATPQYDRPGLETGPLGRHVGHPLIQSLQSNAKMRLLAKLLDLAKMLMELPDKIDAIGEDEKPTQADAPLKGLGMVEAVRGLLFHRIWLSDDGQKIDRYRILAPTEWNFHPEGPLTQALIGTKFHDNRKLLEQARLFVLALDPCVACDIQLSELDQRNHA